MANIGIDGWRALAILLELLLCTWYKNLLCRQPEPLGSAEVTLNRPLRGAEGRKPGWPKSLKTQYFFR